MRENGLGCKGLPTLEQFCPPLRGKLRCVVGVVDFISWPVFRCDGVGVDELQRDGSENPIEERCLAGPVRPGDDVKDWI